MKSSLRSGEALDYQSTVTLDSETTPGVSFRIARMSFGRRIDLTRRIREVSGRLAFAQAGNDLTDKVEAAVLANEIEKLYVEWGLQEIRGLQIDGETATPERLLAAGPEALCREIARAVKSECGLSEDERKN